MGAAGLNVFLLHDAAELLPVIERISLRLGELAEFPIETVSLTGIASETESISSRPKKDMREGDVLLFLSRDESDAFNESFVRAYCERASERQLIVFPVMPRSRREHRRSPWRRQLIEQFSPINLDFSMGRETLADQASSAILSRIRLAREGTDLFGRPLPRGSGTEALTRLSEIEASSSADAHASCQMAVKAMDIRLLPTAINCLEVALGKHTTAPVISYWIARLRLAQNSRESAAKALIEASRAARLAEIEDTPEGFSRAAWILASRAAFMSGDEGSALSFLREATNGTMTASDWIEVARRNAEMQHGPRTLAALKEGFRINAQIYLEALNEVDFSFISTELARQNTELHEDTAAFAQRLLEAEKYVIQQHDAQLEEPEEAIELEPMAAGERPDGTLLEMVERAQASCARQLSLLSSWGQALADDARRHREIQQRLAQLPASRPEAPKKERWEILLLKYLPLLRRKWDALEAAATDQAILRVELLETVDELSRSLPTRVRKFLSALNYFENAALRDEPFLLLETGSIDPRGDLVHLSKSAEQWQLANSLLPELLKTYASDESAAEPKTYSVG